MHLRLRIFALAALLLISTPFHSFAGNSVREKILFNNGWTFSLGSAVDRTKDFSHGTEYFSHVAKILSNNGNEGPVSPSFDDSSWQKVDLPHDWVVDLPFAAEASHSHGYKCIGWRYPDSSVGWYRKKFTVPEGDRGKRILIEFEGIFRDSEVFCNGIYLGHERSGYASSVYDLTEYLDYGAENLITVRADASLEEGWYYEGAGIYRNVYLHKSGRTAIEPYGVTLKEYRFNP
ncbi:MAG: beta-galactosidase, partial [Bacteroidales bacterium]|nr:beta-galactosidase [Bacteroidales bacterium]